MELPELANPELVEAMRGLSEEDNADHRQRFYELLLESMLIIPAPETPEDGESEQELQPLGEEEAVSFVTFEDDAGNTILIAFTDEDATLAWEPEGLPYIALHGFHLLQIAAQSEVNEIVVNPAGPAPYRLGDDEISALAAGNTTAAQPAPEGAGSRGMTVLIEAPDEMPPESWLEAVSEILDEYLSVDAAYYFQLHIPPQGSRNVLGLVLFEGMSAGAQDRLIQTMMTEFEALLPADQSLDIVILDESDFIQAIQDTVDPIHERSEEF